MGDLNGEPPGFDHNADPYHIHQSDNPGMLLVTQPLASDNYNSWKRSMLMALSAKNKIGFVDGSIVAPASTSTNFQAWTRANNLVNSWILNSVSKDISASLLYHSTVVAIWKDLEERFQQNNGPRIFQLKKKLSDLTQGSMNISIYYTQLKIIWDELASVKPTCTCLQCSCGGLRKVLDDQQQELTMQFLMGLNETFANVRSQILLIDPMPSIAKVFSLVIQDENQRSIALHTPVVEAAFTVKAYAPPKKSCPQCTHCHLIGHTKEKCYKLHGYPPGYVSKARQSHATHVNAASSAVDSYVSHDSLSASQCQQLIAMLTTQLQAASSADLSSSSINFAMQGKILSYVNLFSTFDSKRYWIIDSGASRHVCAFKESFDSLCSIQGGSIMLPDNSTVMVEYSGTIRLSSKLVLHDVLYVPEFKFNLLADLWHVIGRAECHQGLYLLELPVASCHSESAVVLANWHDRLGHPSKNVLNLLQDVLPSHSVNKKESCMICPLAKQQCLPFPTSVTCTNTPFQLIHCDTWGPYKSATYDNHHFFLTLVDDYTRTTWTYLMKHKSDATKIVLAFVNMVKKQFGFDVRMFRSDNAPELRFADFFSSLGIIHQFSCVETPQQNSVVKRKHQHLLAVARALFFQSRVPIRFWGDCILTTTFLINRLPTPVLGNKSPFEVLHSTTPVYQQLKVFGCLCFVSTLKAHRDKFSERALLGVFLGYVAGVKGYKVYILKTRSIVVSRNVIFHEEVFPFHSITDIDTVVDPFSNMSLPRFLNTDVSYQDEFQANADLPADEFQETSTEVIGENDLEVSIEAAPVETSPIEISVEAAPVDNDQSISGIPTRYDSAVVTTKIMPRRSVRATQKPNYLAQYYCNGALSPSCPYPIEDYVSTSLLSEPYKAFVSNIASTYEPTFFHQAVKFPVWRSAMDEEIHTMETLQTWSVVPLPEGKQAIDCKWVYRIKHKADGSIDRYKHD
ncbi:hypothetical protein GQ457_10G003950 [Hibiscus cannabinus]